MVIRIFDSNQHFVYLRIKTQEFNLMAMTSKEIHKFITESDHREWLNTVSINIKFFHEAEPIHRKGLASVYLFFKEEVEKWETKSELPTNLKNMKDHFSNCVNTIINYINLIDARDLSTIQQDWKRNTNNLTANKLNNDNIILADSPIVDYLITVQKKYSSSYNSTYNYLVNNRIMRVSNPDEFRGITLGYEFELQDYSQIISRRESDKRSIAQIRSRFEAKLNEMEEITQEYFNNTRVNYDNHIEQLDLLKKGKDESFQKWFSETQTSFNTFYTEAKNYIKEKEELYKEKLRLEAPVKYWSKRAMILNIFSSISILILIGVVLGSSKILYMLLTEDLDIYKIEDYLGDAGALKWSVIYLTLFSFLAYLIRTIAKISFSFLHLARDAEERKQLTHVYLALSEESEMSTEDREIVLQSIFSRAETGLLKGDSSPTMPGMFIDRVTGNKI